MAQNNKQFKAEHNEPFNADSATIMHSQNQVVIDFKQTTPRLDQVDNDMQHTVITEHNAIVLRPQMAKVLLNLLQENLENYEDKFGEIDLPEQDGQDTPDDATQDSHGYIG